MDNECDLEFRKNLEAERKKLDVERQMRKTYEAISQDAKEPSDDTCALTSPEEEEGQLPSFTKRQRRSYGKPDAARMYEIAQIHATLPNIDYDVRRAFPKPTDYVDRYSPTQQTLRHHPYVGYTLGGRHYGSLPPDESHLSDDVIAANRQRIIPLPARQSDRFTIEWEPAKKKFKSPYVAGGIKRVGRTGTTYRQPIRNEELYKIDYRKKIKGCRTVAELDDMEKMLLEEADRHKVNLGAAKAAQRAEMVKGYASRYRKKLASEDRSKTIEALKQGILEKARDDEHEGNLAWDYGFEQALKKEAYRQAVDIVDENEPEYLLSPEFFKTEFAEDVNLSFLSPERYYKPQPVTKAEKAERAKSQTRLERERLLAAVEEGRARRKRLNEAEKRRQERWKYEESLRQMPEPSAEPKPRRRMKPTVCKDYTDEQMAKYFVPKGRPLRDKLPPPKPSPVKKKEDDGLYDPFPPARSPPTPKPWPSVWSYRDTPLPIVLPIPEGLPTPLQPRKYRKPIKRAVPRPVRTPKKPPGPLSHPLPESLPCPMNAQQIPAPFVIPPEYLKKPYLSQEERDRYNKLIGSQRLAFDFTPFQTPETVHALWNKLDQQTQALEKRRKEIIELKTLRNQHEVLLVHQQMKIQKLLEGIKCPTTPPEEKAELAKELQLLEKQHVEAKRQLLEILAILLKIAEQQQKQWIAQKKQEEQCAIRPDTRRPGDERLSQRFVLQAPPKKKQEASGQGSSDDVCPLPYSSPSPSPQPIRPPVAFTVPWRDETP